MQQQKDTEEHCGLNEMINMVVSEELVQMPTLIDIQVARYVKKPRMKQVNWLEIEIMLELT